MNILRVLCRFTHSPHRQFPIPATVIFSDGYYNLGLAQRMSTFSEEPELKEFIDYIDNLKNYEKCGVPKGAGTDSEDGFDLGRMRRLMQLLDNPHCKFKAVHIAGTKGKGSTAAFLSSILRAEGYSVGCYTSPHIQTIRERITLGISGDPVSAKTLSNHFQSIRTLIDQAIEVENWHLTHFEVFTAVALSLFARESVDIAVIEAGLGGARDATNVISSSTLAASIITTIGEEHLAALGGSLESIAVAKSGIIKDGRPLVLGGPFLPHIEHILRDKASIFSSPVVSASDTANRSILKSLDKTYGTPRQSCDIVLQIEKDLQLLIELLDVKLLMLGSHQLKNAVTATCAALCLRGQGWRLSNDSIRAGLERAFLPGRNQILTPKEAEMLGLPGTTILVDGAHTKESARALASTIEMVFPGRELVLVVAMANDKDHLGFARELLTGPRGWSFISEHGLYGKVLKLMLPWQEVPLVKGLDAVLFTEVSIAGDKSRTASVSSLRVSWIQACREMGIRTLDYRIGEHEHFMDQEIHLNERLDFQGILFAEGSLVACIKAGRQILGRRTKGQSGFIVVTGSLHVVSAILGSLKG